MGESPVVTMRSRKPISSGKERTQPLSPVDRHRMAREKAREVRGEHVSGLARYPGSFWDPIKPEYLISAASRFESCWLPGLAIAFPPQDHHLKVLAAQGSNAPACRGRYFYDMRFEPALPANNSDGW